MARKGRETELIVEQLESLCLGEIAMIKSPDMIYDPVAEVNREVDVSIRIKLGSHHFLIIIECRDHKHKQDVTWIEQVITKTKDLHAHKVIAVSTTDFSAAAKNKAKKNNIELRTLHKLDAEEISSWLSKITVVNEVNRFKVINMEIDAVRSDISGTIDINRLSDPADPNPIAEEMTAKDQIFILEQTGERVSLENIISRVNQQHKGALFEGIIQSLQPIVKDLKISFHKHSAILFTEIQGKLYRVVELTIKVKLWKEEEILTIPAINARRYASENETFAEIADYKLAIAGEDEMTLTIQHDIKTNKQNIIITKF